MKLKLSNKIMMAIPVILIITFINVFISSAVAGVIFLQLLSAGHKILAPIIAIIAAVIVYFYILYNHKLKSIIK